MSSIDSAIGIVLSSIFGLLIGSFLNVLIWRLPRKESIQGRSHCPSCGHSLNWLDLFPVVSILLFRAKCRYCKSKISLRYPLIEVITASLFAFAWYSFAPVDFWTSLIFAKALIVIAVCIVVFIIDLEHYLILDKVIFPAIAVMAILALVSLSFENFLAAVAAFIPFWAIWSFSKGKWMGFGDVKYMVFMALALGPIGLVIGLFLSFTIGAIVGLFLIVIGKKDMGSKLPFGTFLALSTILGLFFGQKLWDLYWTLL